MRFAQFSAILTFAIGACVSAPANSSRLTVAIDPGHPSETSSGAEVQNGAAEVHVAWEIAQRVQALLRERGFDAVLTKSRERQLVTNRERADIGNRAKAALMVRLHCDASTDSGFALYYPDRQGTVEGRTGPSSDVMRLSRTAAEFLHAGMAPLLAGHLKDGGVRGDSRTLVGSRQGALTGSIFSEVPVVLIEMVTLSNRHDAEFIASDQGQQLMARAIVQGIERALAR